MVCARGNTLTIFHILIAETITRGRMLNGDLNKQLLYLISISQIPMRSFEVKNRLIMVLVVIVGGTTGEGQLMSWDEHIVLICHTVNCFGGSIKVIGNAGSNSTREPIHATEHGFAVGMHAALHINPYHGKTSLEGLVSHFDSVLLMGPTIIYNVPSRTGEDIPPCVIHTVAKSPNLAGIKECVGNDRIVWDLWCGVEMMISAMMQDGIMG